MARGLVVRAFACVAVAACVALLCLPAGQARADEEPVSGWLAAYTAEVLSELDQAVEEKEAVFNDVKAQVDELAERIAESSQRLERIERQLPVKQRQAERSVRERYKVQRQYGTLLDALLCAQDWRSFWMGLEYIADASEAHIEGLVGLREEQAQLQQAKEQADAEKAALDEQLAAAGAELQEATQRRDDEKRSLELVATTKPVDDGADWKAGKKAFLAEWTKRLDAYLEGSALAGQGKAFAQAAWDNHIDPRWSAAISHIESSKGQICIRPYNAWGWGADDSDPYGHALQWSSWEESCSAHAQGLARGYGYTVSPEGAHKYCPPNWEYWYITVVTQMNSI